MFNGKIIETWPILGEVLLKYIYIIISIATFFIVKFDLFSTSKQNILNIF
jgi:hypothetical protein